MNAYGFLTILTQTFRDPKGQITIVQSQHDQAYSLPIDAA